MGRGHAHENGCFDTLRVFVKFWPGSYIPDERISLDMTPPNICPHVYKDVCGTCATVFRFCSIDGFWRPEGHDYVVEVTEGVIADFPSHGPGTGTMNLDDTVHWIWHNNNREHQGTFSDDCSIVTWEDNKRWIRSTPPAFWEFCHWKDASIEMKRDDERYVGYSCFDHEILVGLEFSMGIVDKIKCCSVGGHSSVIDECSTSLARSSEASCDANDHMVLNGLYDEQNKNAQEDAFLEVMAGVCCKVKCHATWCDGNDWGVSDECKTFKLGQDKGSQDLECPSGYLMTAVHESNNKVTAGWGVQRIDEITCCKLDTIAAPSQAPSLSPSLSPSPSPTTMPTSLGECLVALRDATLTNKQFLEGIEDCVPCMNYQRRNLEGRLLNESHKH